MVALLGMTNDTDVFNTHPVTKKASPITYVTHSDPPILLMHGDKDGLVIYNQSELLYAALREAGVSSHLHKVVNGDHGFRGADESAAELFGRVLAFFTKESRLL